MTATVLIVDDDPIDLIPLRMLMESWNHTAVTAASAPEALQILRTRPVDLVVTDVSMPGMSGDELLESVRKEHPGLPVVLFTGKGNVPAAVSAMRRGAFDYLTKPANEDAMRLCVDRAIEHGRLRRENAALRAELAVDGRYGDRFIARSPAMLAVLETVDRIACTDSTVLLTGETGTGKELVAQTIHYRSRRSAAALVAFNCAALNPHLVESELFGHEKGAFTGALTARRGRFEEAQGGTLFLDEIGETTLEVQAKLLRVLQERCLQRVGGNKNIDVDVRLIASTNRDLTTHIRERTFREDLYYRLCVIPIHLPPLRERKEDILPLAVHWSAACARRYGIPEKSFSAAAEAFLQQQSWPGNVRELQNTVERALLLSKGDQIEADDVRQDRLARAPAPRGDQTLDAKLDAATREHVVAVLEQTGWQKQRAAEILGVDRVTLYRLMKRLSLQQGEGESATAP